MKCTRIGLFGFFGIRNLGNEATLQAVIHNIRERLPAAELYSICCEPNDTSRRHGIPAVAMSWNWLSGFDLRRFIRGIVRELHDWFKAVMVLKGTDVIFMTGTGMLTDYNACTPFSYPYHVFRWATAAKLARCKVRFIGVGVGPVYQRLSRLFIWFALACADYRSYRDLVSKNRLQKLGFESDRDLIFPDLAFSLPRKILPESVDGQGLRPCVGLGVMEYRDTHASGSRDHRSDYMAYLDKTCDFVTWLVEHGYPVRMLQGDTEWDAIVRRDIRVKLEDRGLRYDGCGIVDVDTPSVEGLLAQIALSGVVISPRFHNLVLALMLNKPVISISYDAKSEALLESVGLGKYCQHMSDLDVCLLTDQLLDLESRFSEIKPMLREKVEEYRRLLEEQYNLILGDL